MKGDFTRLTFSRHKRYAKVMMQQGRVQLDQDWNEQMEILAHRFEQQTRDMIGQAGVPQGNAGFGITYDGDADLLIGKGRLYLDGLVCEAFDPDPVLLARDPVYKPLSINNQPWVPATNVWQRPADGTQRMDLVYLKAWERHVGPAEEPGLADVALGGADTATRTQTVWQVLTVEAPYGATPTTNFPAWQELIRKPDGKLSTRAALPAESQSACALPDEGGYRGLENRLYRVEVHQSGSRAGAVFKWSRDNGSVAMPVESVTQNKVTLFSLGRDAHSRFAAGQWVEVLDDAAEFAAGAGTLTRIVAVREADLTLELADDVSRHSGRGARIRRWDMVDGPVTMTGDWQPLEMGVEAKFEDGYYRVGDYWTFATRAAGDWVEPLTLAESHGPKVSFYKLALLRWAVVQGVSGTTRTVGTVEPIETKPRLSRKIDPELSAEEMPKFDREGLLPGDGTEDPTGGEETTVLATNVDCRYHFPPLAAPPVPLPPQQACTFVAPAPDFRQKLQLAIDAAANGGCITLPAGHFVLDQPLSITARSRLTLRGVPGATRLVFNGNGGTMAAVQINGCTDITLEGINLHSKGTATLIKADLTTGLRLSNCRLACMSEQGVAIRSAAGLTELSVQDCLILAGAAIFAAGPLPGLTVERSRLQCLRIGIMAERMTGFTFVDSLLTGVTDTAAFVTAPSHDQTVLNEFERTWRTGAPVEAVLLPVGILAGEGEQWTIANARIRAGIAVGALKAHAVTLRKAAIAAMAGLLTYESSACTVDSCDMNCLPGQSILAFGKAIDWQITGSRLTGAPEAIRFGPIGWESHWLDNLAKAVEQGPHALLPAADYVLIGQQRPVSVITLPAGTGLKTATSQIFTAQVMAAAVSRAADSRALRIAIQQNTLTAVSIHEGCITEQLQVTGNSIDSGGFCGVWLNGTAGPTGGGTVSDNEISTRGIGISLESTGVSAMRNRIHIGGRHDDVIFLNACRTIVVQETGAPDPNLTGVIEALTMRSGAALRSRIERQALEAGAGPDIAVLGASYGRVAAKFLGSDVPKVLIDLASTSMQNSDRDGLRSLSFWARLMMGAMETPSLRMAAPNTAAVQNQVTAFDEGYGTIVIDTPAAAYDPNQPLADLLIQGNTLRGLRSYVIITRQGVQTIRVLENQTEESGGIQLRNCQDITVRGNRLRLPGFIDTGWYAADKVGILLRDAAGYVQVSENRVDTGHWMALEISGTADDADAIIAGNVMTGRQESFNQLVHVVMPQSGITLSQNQFTYTGTQPNTGVAVRLKVERAAIMANIFRDLDYGKPLSVEATAYTLIGNVANNELVGGDNDNVQIEHNAKMPFAHPDDPLIGIVAPNANDNLTSAITVSGTARDRNAPAGDMGVDTVNVYLDGGAGSGTPLSGVVYNTSGTQQGTWTATLDPKARNLSYGQHSLVVTAHSTVRPDITRTATRFFNVSKIVGTDPSLSITSPASESVTLTAGNITLQGTAKDDNASGGKKGIKQIQLYLNGEKDKGGTHLATVTPGDTGAWSYTWAAGTLAYTTYTIDVYAISERNNDSTRKRVTITLVPVHANHPVLTIGSPTVNTTYAAGSSLTVTGTAYDSNSTTAPGVNGVTLHLTDLTTNTTTKLTDSISPATNGNWSYTFTLPALAGNYRLKATTYSPRQNISKDVTVDFKVWHSSQPHLSLWFPYPGNAIARGSSVEFWGKAYDQNNRTLPNYGIDAVEILMQTSTNPAGVRIGFAELGKASPDEGDYYSGTYTLSGWKRGWTASTSPYQASLAPETRTMSLAREPISTMRDEEDPWPYPDPEPTPEPVYTSQVVTLIFKATSKVDGSVTTKTQNYTIYWYE